MHLMAFDAGQIREPDESRFFISYDIVDLVFVAEGHVIYPARRPFGPIFLKEGFSVDPVRKPDKRQRPPFDMLDQGWGDAMIVFDQLGFNDVVGRKENLLKIRELDLALADINASGGSSHFSFAVTAMVVPG